MTVRALESLRQPAAAQLPQHQVLPPQIPATLLYEMVAHPPQMPPLTFPLPPYVATQHA